MGAYYREWLSGERLLNQRGCRDAGRIYIHADTDQRTIETGRALAETLLPGCPVAVHSEPEGSRDPLFDPISAGIAKPDWEIAAKAVREHMGDGRHFLDLHRAAFDTLRLVLAGRGEPNQLLEPPKEIKVSTTGKSVEVNQQLTVASTLSENLLLEYVNGMQGEDLGWGRLDADTLFRVLELHAAYADLTRRTLYLARTGGSNLLAHMLRSMEQAVTGETVPGALGLPGAAVLIFSGHDTNLSNLSGMLGLSWHLPGSQPHDTPPGGGRLYFLCGSSPARYGTSCSRSILHRRSNRCEAPLHSRWPHRLHRRMLRLRVVNPQRIISAAPGILLRDHFRKPSTTDSSRCNRGRSRIVHGSNLDHKSYVAGRLLHRYQSDNELCPYQKPCLH